MKVTIFFFAILFVIFAYRTPVFAMGGDHPPGPVHAQDGWPAGLVELLNREERVNGIWVNANDFFYFASDTEVFNECLQHYAALKNTPHRLVLHPGVGLTGSLGDERDIPFEWEVRVMRWHEDPSEVPTLVTMELWLGGLVQLDKINVPLNVEVKSGGEIAKFIVEHKAKRKNETPPLAERCNAVKWEIPAGSSDSYPAELREMQKELILAGEKVVSELEASLEDSLNLRRIAAEVVAKWPSDKTRAILVQLVEDDDGMVASQAAFYLGEVGGKELLNPLLAAVRHHEPNVRHAALNALARNSDYVAESYGAVDAVGIKDKSPSVREAAVRLMAEFRGEKLINKGLEHLRRVVASDKDERVRKAAEKSIRILEARK